MPVQKVEWEKPAGWRQSNRGRAIKPLGDIVYIRRLDPISLSEGGIALPPSEDFTEDIGEIVACGKGRTTSKGVFIPISIRKGQKVMFSTNGHQVTKFNGEELIVTREPSIMAVIA